jgi:hypothetical protein
MRCGEAIGGRSELRTSERGSQEARKVSRRVEKGGGEEAEEADQFKREERPGASGEQQGGRSKDHVSRIGSREAWQRMGRR